MKEHQRFKALGEPEVAAAFLDVARVAGEVAAAIAIPECVRIAPPAMIVSGIAVQRLSDIPVRER